jgi:PKD repeat protein
MLNRRILSILVGLAVPTVAVALLLSTLRTRIVHASPTTYYVAPGGDCNGASPCYDAIQGAVDAASANDEVRVAGGTYTATGAQVVTLGKTITLSGGYSTSDWITAYPITRPTVIDAENVSGRRGLLINSAGVAVTGFAIENGNFSSAGGGIRVDAGSVTLIAIDVRDNSSGGSGGGLYVSNGTVWIYRSTLRRNTAGGDGGAIAMAGAGTSLFGDNVVVADNSSTNAAVYLPAGSTMAGRFWTLVNNGQVAVLAADPPPTPTPTSTSTQSPTPTQTKTPRPTNTPCDCQVANGGGSVDHSNNLESNAAAQRRAMQNVAVTTPMPGAGNNSANCSSCAVSASASTAIVFQDTIVASHTVAGFQGANLSADHVLFFNNASACSSGAVCSNNLSGDPKFINTVGQDYHIGPGSAAVDVGIDIGVSTDLDGNPRPMRLGFDVGAYEQPDLPVAGFTTSSPDWVGNAIVFTNTTVVSGSVTYLWNFGDGAIASFESPAHIYASVGVYTVALTSTNTAGSSTLTGTVTILGADFSSSAPNWLGQATIFTNTSATNGPATYDWDFGDGNFSSEMNPTHSYGLPGLINVVLTMTASGNTSVLTHAVTIYGPPSASFSVNPGWKNIPAPFTNTTIGNPLGDPSITYLWDFGDNQSSVLPNPSHAYANSGHFTATLTATNPAGYDSISQTVLVYTAPTAAFTDSSPDWLGQISQFTNTTIGPMPISYLWAFGDGVTSTVASPTHIYADHGAYSVVLTASNLSGISIVSATHIITAPVVRMLANVSDISEGAGQATVTATLNVASEVTVTVAYSTSDGTARSGSDYQTASGTLSFAPGQLQQSMTVTIINDALHELTETLNINLNNPVNASLGAPNSTALQIVDDDPPPSVRFSQADYSANEWAPAKTITVTLNSMSGVTATVDYATADLSASAGADYTAISGTLVFLPGETAKLISVPLIDDMAHDPGEALLIRLSHPTELTLASPATATLTLIDNDPLVCPADSGQIIPVATTAGTLQLTFYGVSQCGVVSARSSLPPGGLPAGFTPLPTAFDVQVGSLQFAMATVQVPYAASAVATAGIPEGSLRLLHLADGIWKDQTLALDEPGKTITAITDTFSPFVVGAYQIAPCSISINNGAIFTGHLDVNLFSDTAGAAQILASNDGGFTGAVWLTYGTTVPWRLSDAGQRIATLIVYARLQDVNQVLLCNGQTLIDDIIYDPLPPTVSAVVSQLRTGAPDATLVTLTINALDQPGGSGVAEMQVSTNSTFTGAVWRPYATTVQVANPSGPWIYVRARDAVGNVSASVAVLVPGQGVSLYLPAVMR